VVASAEHQNSPAFVQMSYLDALVQAQVEEMERDSRIILMGEDIAVYDGGKLVQRFGPKDPRKINFTFCASVSESMV